MNRSLSLRRLLVCASLVLLPFTAGCELLGGNDEKDAAPAGVLVANQGNFTQGNGSVTAYDPETGQVDAGVISGLGAIIQSIHLSGGRIYVVANTGDRIDVFDADTYEQVGQIGGLVSPRYMVDGPGGRAYVTNQYGAAGSFTGGSVSVLDLASNTKRKDIPVADNPEGLALAGNRLYVTHHVFGNGRTISVIDVETEAVVDTIDVDCDGPRAIFADREGDVFVFCTGKTLYDDAFNVIGETNAAVRVLDGETGAILKRIEIDGRIGTPAPGQDAFYASGSNEIYAVKDEHTVLRFDTARNVLAGQIGPLEGGTIGAVAYDAASEVLYVAHVPSFTERGTVTLHDRGGALVGSFTAGVVPSHIAFRE